MVIQWLKLDQNNKEMLWVRKLCSQSLTDHSAQLPCQWLIPAPCCEWTSETLPNSRQRNLMQSLHFLLIHLFITVLHSKPCYGQEGMHHVAHQLDICCHHILTHADTSTHTLIPSAAAPQTHNCLWPMVWTPVCCTQTPNTHMHRE